MSKGVHNIAFYVSPDPECSRTTQNPEISIAPSRGRILYAIYGNRTCIISHIVVTAIDKKYRNYYVSTQYLVHWKGYPKLDDQWIPWSDLNTPELLAEFQQENPDTVVHIKTGQSEETTTTVPSPLPPTS